jgi:hypothetical protein
MVMIAQLSGMSEESAIARYEASADAIGDRDVIFLCGVAC